MLCQIFTWLAASAVLGVRAEERACVSVLDRSIPWGVTIPSDSLLSISRRHSRVSLIPSKPQLLVHLSVTFWVFRGHEFLWGCFKSACHLICCLLLLRITSFRSTPRDLCLPVLMLGSEVWVSGPGSKTYRQFLLFSPPYFWEEWRVWHIFFSQRFISSWGLAALLCTVYLILLEIKRF